MLQRVLFIMICLVCCLFPDVQGQTSIKPESKPQPTTQRKITCVENDGTPLQVVYKGQVYEVQNGKRGGKFIEVPDSTGKQVKHYIPSIAKSTIHDNGNGTAQYRGKAWPIQIGKRGGRFILTPNDRGGTDKRYLPK